MNFINSKELLDLCHQKSWMISEVMMERESQHFQCTREEMKKRMAHIYDTMKHAAERALKENLVSVDGHAMGESKQLFIRAAQHSVCGGMMSKAISYAVGILEVNRAMGLTVATPTNGSSGVIAGVLLSMQEHFELSDEKMIQALFHAGAIGYLITRSGIALDGEETCKLEIGVASAMAASAVCELMGAAPETSLQAATIALTNYLGTIGDLEMDEVKIPCSKSNAIGVSKALVSAEMSLCGIGYALSFDQALEKLHFAVSNRRMEV